MRRGKFVRWGVPIAAAVVVGAAIGTGPVIAAVSGDPVLPERTAAELLAVATTSVHKGGGVKPMSGTVLETASLGLPALPQAGEASPLSMLSGSREIKVWYGAMDKIRVALPTQMSETNLIVNGDQSWFWNSAENTATRVKFTPEADKQEHQLPTPSPSDLTPQQAAEKALAMVGEYSAVSVSNTDQVAGRAVYQLVLTPKDPGSLVQDVRIALDGENYVPLRVQVFAKGSAEAAFEVKFTEVTFTPPAEENFTFTPPAGAKVVDQTIGGTDAKQEEKAKELSGAAKVVGEGWTSVAVLPMPKAEAKDGKDPIAEFLKTATPVEGGKIITTKLLTAMVTDDGRLLVGAVTPEVLQKAAQTR